MTRKYSYHYDGLNRLLQANYRNNNLSINDTYNEALTYDKNGNIQTLQRNGNFESQTTTYMIDNLLYLYQDNSNKLAKVIDATNSSQGFFDRGDSTADPNISPDYSYDQDGNMTADVNKNITLIKYNHLNLPTEIQFTNNRMINYFYDAAGIKLKKVVHHQNHDVITNYLDGFQYQEKPIVYGGLGEPILQFFPHAEGYVNAIKKTDFYKYQYVYNYTDHLGNIRLSYTNYDGNPKKLEETHYYPFGLKHRF